MSYSIEPMSIIQFISDSKMKLPRFQRKKTWDNKQRFELCVSIFQDYPVGVVIVNKEKNISWLLDGRQRRETLVEMHNNPVDVYSWARSYIGFSKSANELEVIDKYNKKINKYLQKENLKESDVDVDYEGVEEDEEFSINSQKQQAGLNVLLDMILMVHNLDKNGISKWEHTFDFKDYFYKQQQPYSYSKSNKNVDPVKLKAFLLDVSKKIDNGDLSLTKDSFYEYLDEKGVIADGKEDDLKKIIDINWKLIANSITTIGKFEKILEDSRIGIIHLSNVSNLDAQNIFSRVNKGGTLLKAEELLSAKPFWNYKVNISSNAFADMVRDMYKQLEVEVPDDIVRWDLAATVIQRIKDNNLFFYHNDKDQIDMTELTLGFKVLSSYFVEGMSNKSVIELENKTDIDWENDIDELISNINTISKILMTDSFFKYYQSWNKSMSKLLGNAITLEYITILLKDWESKEKPTVSGNDLKPFKRDARVLFDRLVFEYATKVWRGSGDSKMSNDIKNWTERLKPIDKQEWTNLITSVCSGQFNGQPVTQKVLTPVLYYYYVLQDLSPTLTIDTTYEVDHLIPQEKFKGNSMVDPNMMDSLINLSLLPKKDNISKSSKSLNEINDQWLKDAIVKFADIKLEDFDKYSDISNLSDLMEYRKQRFLNVFENLRETKLSN